MSTWAELQTGRSLVRSQLVSLELFTDIKSFRSHYGPEVDSASNRNEYQEYFLGGKSGRCVRLINLPLSCAVVMKSGNLNFLEPSGPLQACNGTALPLPVSACYHSVQNLLSSSLFSSNIKIKIYRTIILPVFCISMMLGRSHWGKNVGWGCLRIGCWGEYWGLRGTR